MPPATSPRHFGFQRLAARGTWLAAIALVLSACGENETPPPEHGPYDGGATAPLPCTPNLDGKIDARELAPSLGTFATYLVSPPGTGRQVNLAGAPDAAGRLTWQLGVQYADDRAIRVAAVPIAGKWYEGTFATVEGAFVVPLDAGATTEGIYTHREDGFFLHGVASAREDIPDKTIYAYDTPIMVYRFPLEPGASWTTVSTVRNGTFRGLPYAGRDTYEVKVDGAGHLELPDYTLTQALRVRTLVTIEPAAGVVTTQRQVSFLFECIGEVARATSSLNEADEGFSNAAELRRAGLAP